MTNKTPETTGELLTLIEVANRLKLNIRSVRRMIRPNGKKTPTLKAVNISMGSERCIWRVKESDLQEFINARKNNV